MNTIEAIVEALKKERDQYHEKFSSIERAIAQLQGSTNTPTTNQKNCQNLWAESVLILNELPDPFTKHHLKARIPEIKLRYAGDILSRMCRQGMLVRLNNGTYSKKLLNSNTTTV